MQRNLSEFDVSPDDLPSVIRGLRGVVDVQVFEAPEVVTVDVQTDAVCSEQTHWIELLQRTIALLATNTYQRRAHVIMRPSDVDIDASLDR